MDQAHAKGILPFSQIFSDIFSPHVSFCLCHGTEETAVDTDGPKSRTGNEDPGIFLPIPGLTEAKLSSIFVLT